MQLDLLHDADTGPDMETAAELFAHSTAAPEAVLHLQNETSVLQLFAALGHVLREFTSSEEPASTWRWRSPDANFWHILHKLAK